MSKLFIRHELIPISYKSKPPMKKFIDTLIGSTYYTTPSFVMTRTENWFCSIIVITLLSLFFIGCKNYIIPLFYLLKNLS